MSFTMTDDPSFPSTPFSSSSGSTGTSGCELSDQARAFSTILTAFIGSIVNGISSGFFVAFITGWISWLAGLRVLIGSLYGLYQAYSSDYTRIEEDPIELQEQGGTDKAPESRSGGGTGGITWLPGRARSRFLVAKKLQNRLTRDVTVLGWIGWVYTAVYSPIVQVLWMVDNWTPAAGKLKLIRGLAISVSALGLTIDTKRRYATRLKEMKYGGSPAYAAFVITNAVAGFSMGIMCLALLIKGAIDMQIPVFFYIIYPIFMLIWTAVSFILCPVQDGGIKGFGIIPDVLMGAFAGVFLAAPAFSVMLSSQFPTVGPNGFDYPQSGPASLQAYLSCDSVATWQKFVAIFP